MRAFRPLSIAAVSALALAAAPALAQQAEALPPLADAAAGADYAGQPADTAPGAENAHEAPGWDGPPPPPAVREDGPPSRWRGGRDGRRPMPARPHSQPDFPARHDEPMRVGYSPEERDGWLEECSDRLDGDRHDRDHDGRAHQECEAYLHSYEASYRGYAENAYYGAGGAYPVAAAPVMLIPVLLPTQNCGCPPKRTVRTIVTYETVPEKVVTYERVPTKTVRTKYVKTVAIKTTKPRSIKSTK